MQFKFRMRGLKLNTGKVKRKYQAGRNKALDKAGSMVRQSAKKQLSNRKLLTKPVWKRVGEYQGVPLVSMSFQNSKPGKVTSWKPKRFLHNRIRYARDDRRGSVVIGPDDKVVEVNTLHERGGSRPMKLVLIRSVPTDGVFQYQVPQSLLGNQGRDRRGRFLRQSAYIGMWHSTGKRVRGRVVRRDPGRAPAGRYMEKGLAAKRDRIAATFKDQISGP